MAERRMFAKAITNKLKFLSLPPTARLLYYDLGMAADDDGAVESFVVMRTTGASQEDLALLEQNGFIDILNDELTAYIIDWRTNNQIRKDRYHESIYADLLLEKGYPVGAEQPSPKMATNGKPNGNQRLPQVSIGKVSQVKDRKDKGSDEGEREPLRLEFPRMNPAQLAARERANAIKLQCGKTTLQEQV